MFSFFANSFAHIISSPSEKETTRGNESNRGSLDNMASNGNCGNQMDAIYSSILFCSLFVLFSCKLMKSPTQFCTLVYSRHENYFTYLL